MKLHTFVGSPSGRKVEAVINHLKLDVQVEYYDALAGELRTPEYLALNPNGKVPTFVDGTFTLWESNAITQYLADKAGSDALFPRDSRKRAEVVRWQFWETAHFNKAFGTLVLEALIKPRRNLGPTDDSKVASASADLLRAAPVLNLHLTNRQYLVGEGITIADYSMICLEPYEAAIPFDWAPYPNVSAYFDRMRRTAHWKRTAPVSSDAVGRRPKAA
jgi:glutathione S-transferase